MNFALHKWAHEHPAQFLRMIGAGQEGKAAMRGMQINVVREPEGYAVHTCGSFTLRLDDELLRSAVRAAMKCRIAGDDEVGGFFDVLQKGLGSIAQIGRNPLVRAVISAIPYAGTAMSAVELANEGAKLANKAMAKRPHAARLVKAAARKDPAALAQIRQIKADAKQGKPGAAVALRNIAQVAALAADRHELVKHVAQSAALPPGYEYVYE